LYGGALPVFAGELDDVSSGGKGYAYGVAASVAEDGDGLGDSSAVPSLHHVGDERRREDEDRDDFAENEDEDGEGGNDEGNGLDENGEGGEGEGEPLGRGGDTSDEDYEGDEVRGCLSLRIFDERERRQN
jgi:hypothetical protein